MTKEITLDDLKRYRALVETGSVLDKNTVLSIISHAGEAAEAIQRKQEALDTVARIVETQCEAVVKATDSYDVIDDDFDGDWDAVWSRLAELADQKRQAERNADTYQKLYEQRAESLEQAEHAVARVREFSDQLRGYCSPYGVAHDYAKQLDRALDGDQA